MDIQSSVIEWCRTMSYDGDIPPTLENICSHSTSFLWQDLLQNTKPKQEVKAIHINVILQRLKEKPLEKQDEYTFSIREIDLYRKRQELQKKKNILEEIVKEKKSKASHLAKNARMKCMSKELLSSNIKENVEKEYLLNLKAKELQKQIVESEEMFTTARNVTPIELDESPNKTQITETLHKCAEKLLIFVQNTSQTHANNYNHEKSSVTHLILKTPAKPDTTMDFYFTLSNRKNFNKIPIHLPSESVDTNKQICVSSERIQNNLFVNLNLPEIVEPTSAKVEIAKQKKSRESLGILHESCILNVSNDSFLLDMESVLSPIKQNRIEKSPNITAESENLNDSTISSLMSMRTNKELNSACSETDPTKKRDMEYDKIMENDAVTNELRNLIYKHNRQAVWNIVQNMNDNLCIEITNRVMETSKRKSKQQCFRHDIAKLHLIHVQNGLRIMEQKVIIRELLTKISRWQTDTYRKLRSLGEEVYKQITNSFSLKLKDVRYDAALAEMKKQIQLAKKVSDSTELQVVLGKISKLKDEIASKTLLIQQHIEFIEKMNSRTLKTRDSTKVSVRKLQPFICDMSWSEPLTEARFSEEIKVFEHFPLEFNRACSNINSKVYYRDLCVSSFPIHRELDSDSMYMLSEVLKNPLSPPETILMEFIKMKTRLQTDHSDITCENLNALKSKLLNLKIDDKGSTRHLHHHHNDQIKCIMNKLHSILVSPSANKILSLSNTMKKAVDIWEEMHLEDHIPPSRLVDGSPYQFYDDKFNLLLEKLKYLD